MGDGGPWIQHPFVELVFQVAQSDIFQNTIMLFILANVIVMCLDLSGPAEFSSPWSRDIQVSEKYVGNCCGLADKTSAFPGVPTIMLCKYRYTS